MGVFLLIFLFFAGGVIYVLTRAVTKKGKLEDYDATLQSGSRDPKTYYAHKRQKRQVSLLVCIIIALIIYILICMI